MTSAEAAALHARASADNGLVMWFVTLTDPAHPGRAVAYAMQGDHIGGRRLSGELVADTVEAVRAMCRRACGDMTIQHTIQLGRWRRGTDALAPFFKAFGSFACYK